MECVAPAGGHVKIQPDAAMEAFAASLSELVKLVITIGLAVLLPKAMERLRASWPRFP